MIRRSLLVAAVLALSAVGQANADVFTTGLVTTNGQLAGGSQVTNTAFFSQTGGGVAWTADVTSSSGAVGDAAHLIGVMSLTSATNNVAPPSPTGSQFLAPTNQLAVVFALQGTVTSSSPGNTNTVFTSGQAIIINRGSSSAINPLDPTTWVPVGSVQLQTLTLNNTPISAVQMGGTGTDSPVVPNPGAINSDPVAVGPMASLQSNPDFLFSVGSGSFLTNFNLANNSNPLILSLINAQLQGAGGVNPAGPNASQLAAANAIFLALQGVPFRSTFTPTSPQNPGFNFQTIATITGGQNDPGSTPTVTPPPGVPEPASMLLWGAVAVGFGVARKLRRSKRSVA